MREFFGDEIQLSANFIRFRPQILRCKCKKYDNCAEACQSRRSRKTWHAEKARLDWKSQRRYSRERNFQSLGCLNFSYLYPRDPPAPSPPRGQVQPARGDAPLIRTCGGGSRRSARSASGVPRCPRSTLHLGRGSGVFVPRWRRQNERVAEEEGPVGQSDRKAVLKLLLLLANATIRITIFSFSRNFEMFELHAFGPYLGAPQVDRLERH